LNILSGIHTDFFARKSKNHYAVKTFSDGHVLLEPRVLVPPEAVSKRTLKMMDKAANNFKQGKLSRDEEKFFKKWIKETAQSTVLRWSPGAPPGKGGSRGPERFLNEGALWLILEGRAPARLLGILSVRFSLAWRRRGAPPSSWGIRCP
jgi:hypothetical protein